MIFCVLIMFFFPTQIWDTLLWGENIFFNFIKALHTFFFLIFFRKLFMRLGGPEALDFFQSVHKARLIKYKFLGVKVKLGSRD